MKNNSIDNEKMRNCIECAKLITNDYRKCIICAAAAHLHCSEQKDRVNKLGFFYCKHHIKLIPENTKRIQHNPNSIPQVKIPIVQNQTKYLTMEGNNNGPFKICKLCSTFVPNDPSQITCVLCANHFHLNCITNANNIDKDNYVCKECESLTNPLAIKQNNNEIMNVVLANDENQNRSEKLLNALRPTVMRNPSGSHEAGFAVENVYVQQIAENNQQQNLAIGHNRNVDNSIHDLQRQINHAENKYPPANANPVHTGAVPKRAEHEFTNAKTHPFSHLEHNDSPQFVTLDQYNDLVIKFNQLLTIMNNQNGNAKSSTPINKNNLNNDACAINIDDQASEASFNDHNPNILTRILEATLEQNKKQSELIEQTRLDRMKIANKNLHKVKDVIIDWPIFYQNYLDTKDLFSNNENATRVRDALTESTIIDKYGLNLLNPGTCEATLARINQELGGSDQLLIKQYHAIFKNQKRLNMNNKNELIIYIQKVLNYIDSCMYFGDSYTQGSLETLARLTNILPPSLTERWNNYAAIREFNNERTTLITLSTWLRGLLPGLNRLLLSMEIDTLNQDKKKSEDKNEAAQKSQKNKSKPNTNAIYNTNNNAKASNKFCWFHRNATHYPSDCKLLLSKNGKEVSDLAKQHNICTICGRTKHNGECFGKDKIPECKLCKKHHRILYCFKRQGSINISNANNESHTRNLAPRNNNNNSTFSHRENSNSLSQHSPSYNNDDFVISSNAQEATQTDQSHLHNRIKNGEVKNPNKISCEQFYINNSRSNAHFSHIFRNNNETNCYHENNHKAGSVFSQSRVDFKTSVSLIATVVLKLAGHPEEYAFLLDSGSSITMIEQSVADKLKLLGYRQPLSVGWTGTTTKNDDNSRIVYTTAKGIGHNAKEYILFFHTMKDLHVRDQQFNSHEMQQLYPHLRKLNLTSYNKVVGILGTDQSWIFQLNTHCPKEIYPDTPIGLRSPLGDCVVGNGYPISKQFTLLKHDNNAQLAHRNHAICYFHKSVDCEKLSCEEEILLGIDYYKSFESEREFVEDIQAINILKSEVKRHNNGINFIAPLLWKDPNVILPTKDSYDLSLKRLRLFEKSLIKKGFYDIARDEIKNLLTKGYATKLSDSDIFNGSPKEFYSPIFMIEGNRKRLIWDVAAKVNNKSLNDHLVSGPNLYIELISLLYGMREGMILVKGDIAEMFHQVHIRDVDKDALRFLFSETPFGKVKAYHMNVLLFGAVCSPTISQFIKNHIAEIHSHEFPVASELIKKRIYVDDYLKSHNDVNEASQRLYEVRYILSKAGFNLVKLNSNVKEALKLVKLKASHDDINNPKFISPIECEKILGYNLDLQEDHLSLVITFKKLDFELLNGKTKPTKKEVLRVVMSVFDPLGLFDFFTSKLKLIYHWICKKNMDWDQIIDDHLFISWKKVLKWFRDIASIKIPRAYSMKLNTPHKKELWAFSDAGKEIVCCVMYIRIVDLKGNQIDVSIIGAKSSIVPVRQSRTIPELELDSVDKCIKQIHKIIKYHECTFDEFHVVTDSTCVFEWVTSGCKKPTVYVDNRLKRIKSSEVPFIFKWISTDLQPADYSTKFSSMPELTFNNKWFQPEIFRRPESTWPDFKPPTNINLNFTVIKDEKQIESLINFSKYSNIEKIIRIVQLLHCWKHCKHLRKLKDDLKDAKIRLKSSENKITLKNHIRKLEIEIKEIIETVTTFSSDYEKSLLWIIRTEQNKYFEDVIKILLDKHYLPKSHKLFRFNPILDKDGTLRASTRIEVTEENLRKFSYDRIRPIILPVESYITKLIILQAHANNDHLHHRGVIAKLLSKYFIKNANWVVKKIIRENCFVCKKNNARPLIPSMGSLPFGRLGFEQPAFTYCMLDVAGPFTITPYNKPMKRWLLVITCLTTRAIHIEILKSMDANSALMGFLNTCYLRGKPEFVISDPGTNFIGGRRLLITAWNEYNIKLRQQGLSPLTITWETHPARASWMNGAVERLIGLMKNAMKKVMSRMKQNFIQLNDEQLRHLICKVINMLNERPLVPIAFQTPENQFLTPNMFIMLRPNAMSLPVETTEVQRHLLKYSKEIQSLESDIWNTWLKAYFPTILHKEKWINRSKNLEAGDIVITADPTISNSWRMGVIIDVTKGSDNQVRKVSILLGNNSLLKNCKNTSDRKKILKAYREEPRTVISRPAQLVAPIGLQSEAFKLAQ